MHPVRERNSLPIQLSGTPFPQELEKLVLKSGKEISFLFPNGHRVCIVNQSSLEVTVSNPYLFKLQENEQLVIDIFFKDNFFQGGSEIKLYEDQLFTAREQTFTLSDDEAITIKVTPAFRSPEAVWRLANLNQIIQPHDRSEEKNG
jgi:hypothetical protein